MEVVKLKLYQNMVNYRREMSFGYVQTYPLPTPSMIRGMIHALLDAKEYYPLKISIQGDYNSVVTNMQKVYKFDRPPDARPDNPYLIDFNTTIKTAKHGLMFVDLLVDVYLVVHIAFDEPELNNTLYESAQSSTIVLGRNEDIARVDKCELITLNSTDDEIETPNSMYIPEKFCNDNNLEVIGTTYRLPFKYAEIESFEDKRIFDFINAKYISKNNVIEVDNLYIDNENNPVIMLGL